MASEINFSLCSMQNISAETQITACYDLLVEAMIRATYGYRFSSDKRFKPVPGWNSFCKDKYAVARNAFLNWVRNGKIRTGVDFELMLATRKEFRRALRYCRSHEQQIRDSMLANNFKAGRMKHAWSEVNRRRGKTAAQPSQIDGQSDSALIAENFKVKFSVITGGLYEEPTSRANYSMQEYKNLLGIDDVHSAVSRLGTGIGHDGLHSNHLKYLSKSNLEFIKMFLNTCISNAFIPDSMLIGIVKPLPKNKFGDAQNSENYREIMISTNLYKVMEYCLLSRMQSKVTLSHHQYGYRPNTSTILATALLKETLHKYVDQGSRVYTCFLDLSKAFERVDHDKLLSKMQKRGVPEYLLKIFRYTFASSYIKVKYNGTFSEYWKATCGVRQGGVTSAFLFSLYIDDILTEIASQPYACSLGYSKLNVLAYADDVVLLCPSAMGLRYLIAKFENLIKENRLVINAEKTKTMIFRKASCVSTVEFLMNGIPLEQVDQFRYLGSILNSRLLEKFDVERILGCFNRSVGAFMRKFGALELPLKDNLYESLCMSLYGLEIFMSRQNCVSDLRRLGVAYHYAIKKMLGLPKYFSNHYACSMLDRLTFEHLMNFRAMRFFFWLNECESPCFSRYKPFL